MQSVNSIIMDFKAVNHPIDFSEKGMLFYIML
jgi:hypothetical protein